VLPGNRAAAAGKGVAVRRDGVIVALVGRRP
jgi:hypothetical protein